MKHFKEKFKSIWKNKLAIKLVGGIDSANLGVIFLLALLNALSGIGAFITFPIAMGVNAVNSILSIRQAYLSGKKRGKKDKRAILAAVATTTVSALVITAIILTFVGVGVVAPAILCGALGLKSLYELGESIWCIYKFIKYRHSDPVKAKKYAVEALEHSLGFIIGAGATAAIAAVLIAHKSSFGALGVVLGAVGAALSVYGGVKLYKKNKAKLKQEVENKVVSINAENPDLEYELTNNASLHARIGNTLSQFLEHGIDLNQSVSPENAQVKQPQIAMPSVQPFEITTEQSMAYRMR